MKPNMRQIGAVAFLAAVNGSPNRRVDPGISASEMEALSIVNVVSKTKEFQEAAREMLDNILDAGGLETIHDPAALAILPDKFFPIKKVAASAEARDWAVSTSREILQKELAEYADTLGGDFNEIAREGLREYSKYSDKVYPAFQGVEFVTALGQENYSAIAQNGVAIDVIQRLSHVIEFDELSPSDIAERYLHGKEGISVEQERALSRCLQKMGAEVVKNLEDHRAESVATLKAAAPEPMLG